MTHVITVEMINAIKETVCLSADNNLFILNWKKEVISNRIHRETRTFTVNNKIDIKTVHMCFHHNTLVITYRT